MSKYLIIEIKLCEKGRYFDNLPVTTVNLQTDSLIIEIKQLIEGQIVYRISIYSQKQNILSDTFKIVVT